MMGKIFKREPAVEGQKCRLAKRRAGWPRPKGSGEALSPNKKE
jgi:hypothetical protein